MDILQALTKNGIAFEPTGADTAINCPLCYKTDTFGEPVLCMNIDAITHVGHCSACGKDAEWGRIAEALGIVQPKKKEATVQELPNIKNAKLRLWPVREILGHDFGDQEWVVDSLVPKQGIMALSGNPGDFKTWVTIHIAMCVSRGESVFSKFKTMQGAVLVIDEEDHLQTLQKRLNLLEADDSDAIDYVSQQGIKVDDEETMSAIVKIVKEKDIKLVILDSLVRMHGKEENDAGGMAKVFQSLQKIIKAGASIIFTHHHRKQQKGEKVNGQSMRGSSDILAAIDSHLTLARNRDEEGRLVLTQTKLRQAEPLPVFEVSIIKGEKGPSNFEYLGDYDVKKKKSEEAIEAILSLLEEGMMSRTDIVNALKEGEDIGKASAGDAIKLAESKGLIQKVPKADLREDSGKAYYYRLASTPAELPAS